MSEPNSLNADRATREATGSRTRSFLGRRRRQNWLGWTLLAALAVAGIGVAVVFRNRLRRPAEPKIVSQPLPQNAQQSASGYTFTRSEHNRPVFTVHAERSVAFGSGEGTTLDGVHAEIFGRSGEQNDVLTTKRCQYYADSGNLSCADQVEIEINSARSPAASGPGAKPGAIPGIRQHPAVYLETSAVLYEAANAVATTRAPVKWRYGPASGSGTGLKYAPRDGWVELEHDVALSLPVQGVHGQGSGVLQLSAARLAFQKNEGKVELDGPVTAVDGERRMSAGHAVLHLDAKQRLTQALLDGAVSGFDHTAGSSLEASATTLHAEFDPVSGDLRQMTATGNVKAESKPAGVAEGSRRLAADAVQVEFVGAHFHPSDGRATGHVRLSAEAARASGASPQISPMPPANSALAQSSGPKAGSAEELETGDLRFSFRPDTAALTGAKTMGPGTFTLAPGSPKQGRRVATATNLDMAFADGKLSGVRGSAPTQVVIEPAVKSPPGTLPIVSRADNVQAEVDPKTGAIRTFRQWDHYRLDQGDRHAVATEATYAADGSLFALEGRPELSEPGTSLDADHITIHADTRIAEGYGHVSSSHSGGLPTSGEPADRGAAKPLETAQSSPPPDDVTHVLAERVTADGNLKFAHYEGHVRAWRGSDMLEAPALDLYSKERRLVAPEGGSTSNLAPAPAKAHGLDSPAAPKPTARKSAVAKTAPAAPAAPSATQPVSVRADHLEYSDLDRKAVYRGHVRLVGSGATLTADRLDAFFTPADAPEGSRMDHAVADGHVVIVEPGRRASGDHADYLAAPGQIVLTGGPPTLYDEAKGFTTGRILTFYTQDDRLLVDGGEGSRAMSKHHVSK